MVGYLAIVYAIISDICVFKDHLSLAELLGCVAVVCVTIFVGCFKAFSSRKQPQANQFSDDSRILIENELEEKDMNRETLLPFEESYKRSNQNSMTNFQTAPTTTMSSMQLL